MLSVWRVWGGIGALNFRKKEFGLFFLRNFGIKGYVLAIKS